MPERRGLPGLREQSEPPRPRSPLTGRGLGASVHTWGLELGLSGAGPGGWMAELMSPARQSRCTTFAGGGWVTHTAEPRPSPDGTRGPRGGVPAAFLTTYPRPRTVRPPQMHTRVRTRSHTCTHIGPGGQRPLAATELESQSSQARL